MFTSQIYFPVLACGRNIRSAVTNFDFLKIHLENRQSPLALCDEDKRTSRGKRQLPTIATTETHFHRKDAMQDLMSIVGHLIQVRDIVS